MEEKKTAKPHSIFWKDRDKGAITGVKDVQSFDENCVILETEQGVLTIKGKDLHVARLSLEQGEVDVEGKADSFIYSGRNPSEKGKLIRRIFQ